MFKLIIGNYFSTFIKYLYIHQDLCGRTSGFLYNTFLWNLKKFKHLLAYFVILLFCINQLLFTNVVYTYTYIQVLCASDVRNFFEFFASCPLGASNSWGTLLPCLHCFWIGILILLASVDTLLCLNHCLLIWCEIHLYLFCLSMSLMSSIIVYVIASFLSCK